ncbi:MAG: tRNA lysidine(34) synthetase TilS [Saprospiraceae bacterium]
MLHQFQAFLQREQLIPTGGKTLLAVSGGVDSVVLCHLFEAAGLDFAIAHCNFRLRIAAAEEAIFVRDLATQLGVSYWETSFETEQIAQAQKKSIQLLARTLRYDWLQEIAQVNNFDHIATAHHLDDALETLLYNLTKGCGIRGLHGIPVQQAKIIRPLLFAEKAAIRAFAKEKKIDHREDASNAENKYARNLIRNQVIPVLQKINPSLIKTSERTIQQLKETEALFEYAVAQLAPSILTKQTDYTEIRLTPLLAAPAPPTLLYEYLKAYGFRRDQMENMITARVGSQFFSTSYRMVKHRETLLIEKHLAIDSLREHSITTTTGVIALPEGKLHFLGTQAPPTQFDPDPKLVWLDVAPLQFPLRLRRWQAGDHFRPLGMQGKKKSLQDFFSNQKLSLFEKEKVWLLVSGEAICWIVGLRLDERFKVNNKTKMVLALKWEVSLR